MIYFFVTIMAGIAIKWKQWFIKKWYSDEHWQECTKCWIYKTRNEYHRDRSSKTDRRTPNCKECRNAYKKQYRLTSTTDHLYKQRFRQLKIWAIGKLKGSEIPDLLTYGTILTWTVVKYERMKWYLLKCNQIQAKKRINTNKVTFIIDEIWS